MPQGLDVNQRPAFRGIRDEDHFARADTHPLVERQVRRNGFAARLTIPGVCGLVRRGGDPLAATATRRAALFLCGGATAALAVAAATGQLSSSVLVSAAPGLVTATIVAGRPAAPIHLRKLGWALIAASVATAALVIATE